MRGTVVTASGDALGSRRLGVVCAACFGEQRVKRSSSRPVLFVAALLVLLSLAIASAPSVLRAQDAPAASAMDVARERMERGQGFFAARRYAEAAEEFMRAYEAQPFSAFLYNAGAAWEKQGDRARAADFFSRYLERDPEASDARAVRERIARLRGGRAGRNGGAATTGAATTGTATTGAAGTTGAATTAATTGAATTGAATTGAATTGAATTGTATTGTATTGAANTAAAATTGAANTAAAATTGAANTAAAATTAGAGTTGGTTPAVTSSSVTVVTAPSNTAASTASSSGAAATTGTATTGTATTGTATTGTATTGAATTGAATTTGAAAATSPARTATPPPEDEDFKSLLSIRTNPEGARVTITKGGQRVSGGPSPYTATLDPGDFRVVVEHPDYRRIETSVRVRPGKVYVVIVEMSQGEFLGYLRVVTSVPGARVFLDDREAGSVGTTPYQSSVPTGTHRVWVERPGYATAEREVEVGVGEEVVTRIELERAAEGRIRVIANVTGATVSVDDHLVGAVPYEGPVPAGPHRIRIGAEGMKDWEEQLDIRPGQVTPIRVRLKPAPSRGGAWATLTIGALVAGGGLGAAIYTDGLREELDAERRAGRLASNDPRITRGYWLSIGADSAFGLGAVLGLVSLYLFLRDPTPDSEATVLEPRDWTFAPLLEPRTGTAGATVRGSF
jgi:hypothetical protein